MWLTSRVSNSVFWRIQNSELGMKNEECASSAGPATINSTRTGTVKVRIAPMWPEFTPSKWLSNPHAQTIWSRIIRRRLPVVWQREIIDLPDGDELVLDHAAASGAEPLFR